MTTLPATSETLTIEAMGARGDGVARMGGVAIHVPYVLPGETVRARVQGERGTLEAVEVGSPDRVVPPCPHFGTCGGCAFQHWANGPQLAWKREQVVTALARRGIEADIEPTVEAWGDGRRRAAFHTQWVGDRLVFGFAEARSKALVGLMACPVLAPALEQAVPALATLAAVVVQRSEPATLTVTATATGLEVDVRGAGRVARFNRKGLERLAEAVAASGVARLSLAGETAIERRRPVVRMGAAAVEVPPGAFLQATARGEAVLAELVQGHLAGCSKVADLFAGLGTFGLRLKASASVLAFEGDAVMVGAMQKAADALAGGKPFATTARDLFRAPVAPLELKGVDGVVLDPPRAGAEAQCVQLARAKVKRVAMVSCDPTTFARDAAILIEGGFRLERVVPVDQFRWNPHTELVGLFRR